MASISSSSIITTRSAAHRCGNLCRWSKVARPPHPYHQPQIFLSRISHSTCRSLNHTQPPLLTLFSNSITHTDVVHAMSLQEPSLHWITLSCICLHHHSMSTSSQLKGTGCTGMGFTLMLMTNFPNLSFFLIVSGCYTTGGPIIRLWSASPANIPL